MITWIAIGAAGVVFWIGYIIGNWTANQKLVELRREKSALYGRLYALYAAVSDMPRGELTAKVQLALRRAGEEMGQ